METTPTPEKEKPVHLIRRGTIKAVIWKRQAEHGPMFSVRFARIYKVGGDWHDTDSFNKTEVLIVAEVARESFHWIHEHAQESRDKATADAATS